MAKANTNAVPVNNIGGVFESIRNIVDSVFIITRTIKSTTLKAEAITEVATDAVLHSAMHLDAITRKNLAEATA